MYSEYAVTYVPMLKHIHHNQFSFKAKKCMEMHIFRCIQAIAMDWGCGV